MSIDMRRLQARLQERKRLATEERENVWYCEKCDRWQDHRSGCEADIRHDQRERDAALVKAAGCLCKQFTLSAYEVKTTPHPYYPGCYNHTIDPHDPRCPHALAAAILESAS